MNMDTVKHAWWLLAEWAAKKLAYALPDRVVYLVLVHGVSEVSKTHQETQTLTCFEMLNRWRDRPLPAPTPAEEFQAMKRRVEDEIEKTRRSLEL